MLVACRLAGLSAGAQGRAPHPSRRRAARRAALHLVEFVASNREKIDAAKEEWRKADWGCGLFDLPP
jgi:hypothetical protein